MLRLFGARLPGSEQVQQRRPSAGQNRRRSLEIPAVTHRLFEHVAGVEERLDDRAGLFQPALVVVRRPRLARALRNDLAIVVIELAVRRKRLQGLGELGGPVLQPVDLGAALIEAIEA